MIDLHAHILPGLDDGPADLDESAAMAAAAVEGGTRVLAATSHIDPGFGLTGADLAPARRQVAERLKADGIQLEVVQGGEVAVPRAETMDDEELRAVTLGGTPWLLLECSLSPRAPSLEPTVRALQGRGFKILLAHPERAPTLMRSPEPLRRLIDMGALGQVTASSFAGLFGEPARRSAFAMLEHGLVHVLASDSHGLERRVPDLRICLQALERRYEDGERQLQWMAEAAPRALLAGEPLPERPEPPRPRGLLERVFRRGG